MPSPISPLERSSHLPRMVSKLPLTRCEGVHLLVAFGVVLSPVGEANIPFLDTEAARERDPLPRDEVRSRRRF